MRVLCHNCKQVVNLVVQEDGSSVCPACKRQDPITTFPEGTQIEGYLIRDFLGMGGMGVVYRANQINLNRDVAMKVLNNKLAHNTAFVEQFFREARAAACLSHPNVVQAIDAGSNPEGICFFVMELIQGETYESVLERRRRLPESEVKDIAIKIADALNYAFVRQGVSHGDLKPDNLIADPVVGVKLADFGLARSIYDRNDAEREVMATPLYAPPEIVSGQKRDIDIYSDMYSFGATFYHLLVGEPMFPNENPYVAANAHISEIPIPLTEYGISEDFSNIIMRLVEKDPQARFSDWSEVLEQLDVMTINEGDAFGPSPEEYRKNLRNRRFVFYALVGMLGVAVIVVLAILLMPMVSALRPESKNFEAAFNNLSGHVEDIPPAEAAALVQKFIKELPSGHPLHARASQLLERYTPSETRSGALPKVVVESTPDDPTTPGKTVTSLDDEWLTSGLQTNPLVKSSSANKPIQVKSNLNNENRGVRRGNPVSDLKLPIHEPYFRATTWAPRESWTPEKPAKLASASDAKAMRNMMLYWNVLYSLSSKAFDPQQNMVEILGDCKLEASSNLGTLQPYYNAIVKLQSAKFNAIDFLKNKVDAISGMVAPSSFGSEFDGYILNGISQKTKLRFSVFNGGARLSKMKLISDLTPAEYLEIFKNFYNSDKFLSEFSTEEQFAVVIFLCLMQNNPQLNGVMSNLKAYPQWTGLNAFGMYQSEFLRRIEASGLPQRIKENNFSEKDVFHWFAKNDPDFNQKIVELNPSVVPCITELKKCIALPTISSETIKGYPVFCFRNANRGQRSIDFQNSTRANWLSKISPEGRYVYDTCVPYTGFAKPENGAILASRQQSGNRPLVYSALPPLVALLEMECGDWRNASTLQSLMDQYPSLSSNRSGAVAVAYNCALFSQMSGQKVTSSDLNLPYSKNLSVYADVFPSLAVEFERRFLLGSQECLVLPLDALPRGLEKHYALLQLRAAIEFDLPIKAGSHELADFVLYLSKNPDAKIGRNTLNRFTSSSYRAHALVSAVAKYVPMGSKNVDWAYFFESVERVIPNNYIGYPLWHDLTCLKLANAMVPSSPPGVLLRDALAQEGVYTIPDYYGLYSLYILDRYSNLNLSPDDAISLINAEFENFPILYPQVFHPATDPFDWKTRVDFPKLSQVTDPASAYPRSAFWHNLVLLYISGATTPSLSLKPSKMTYAEYAARKAIETYLKSHAPFKP